jgi:hypothetical protein
LEASRRKRKRETARQTLPKDLNMKDTCAKMVQKNLSKKFAENKFSLTFEEDC